MSNQQTKTPQAAVIKEVIRNIFVFSKYHIATVIMAVAFFVHFFLPIKEIEIVKIQAEQSAVEECVEETTSMIVQLAGTDNPFIPEHKRYLQKQQNKLDRLNDIFWKADARHRIFGYPSRHKFLWSFGIGLMFCVASIKILVDSHSKKDKNKRWSSRTLGIMTGIVGGYFMAWIFYPRETIDLSYAAYMCLLVGMGVLASVMGLYLSKHYYYRRNLIERLQKKLSRALDFFVEMRNVHYKKLLVFALKRNKQYNDLHNKILGEDIYKEVQEDILKEETEQFDKRIYEEAENIID